MTALVYVQNAVVKGVIAAITLAIVQNVMVREKSMNSRELRSLEVTDEIVDAACTAYKGERHMVDRWAMREALKAAFSSRTEGPAHHPAPEEQGRDLLQAVSDFYEGNPPYKFGPHWTEELANERDDAWQELYGRIQAYLSSSREAAAPTSSPKGLERWREILHQVQREACDDLCSHPDCLCATDEPEILEAIRRSVEEALGAAHAPKGAPLGGEE